MFDVRFLLKFICLAVLLAAGPTTKPSTTQPAALDAILADGLIHFRSPPSPWASYPVKASDTVYYQTDDHQSAMQAIYAPKDFQLSSDTDGSFAVAILKDLKKKHVDQNTTMVLPPKILKDSRFDIVIHEQFKVGDVTEDELHLYKSVGPRVVMLVTSCVSTDPKRIEQAHKAAEDLLASCKFDRKAWKKQQQ